MEQKTYQLCSRAFRIKAKNGLLQSLLPGPSAPGEAGTQYILPGEAFGRFQLGWVQDGEPGGFSLTPETVPQEERYVREPLSVKYEAAWTAEAAALKMKAVYTLQEDALIYELLVENCGGRPLLLTDAGFSFPCNSDFHWGENAGGKVIGHHFVSGHGSHLLFERCDGKGPLLAVLPQDGTQLEYFQETPAYAVSDGGDGKKETAFTAYAHSTGVRREAEAKGHTPRLPGTEKQLNPGEGERFCFRWEFTDSRQDARRLLARRGLVDVEVLPGLTVPQGQEISLALTSRWEDLRLCPAEGMQLLSEEQRGERRIVRLRLTRLGEIPLTVRFAGDRYMTVTFFATLQPEELLEKRAAFLAKCQHRDPEKWYYGLISEWNNETGMLLGPDNYDRIGGWRIYEVSCDDPGLGKPAFLAAKLAERPEKEQVKALDLYVEHFVWGGLQRTEKEEYPFALYGIPDWKQNRESEDPDLKGKLHIWRIYDYPHIVLLYYSLYRIARDYPDMPLSQKAGVYLYRAARTADAMFTIPLELDGWSAYRTGLYNELVIEDVLRALKEEGMEEELRRLWRHWVRKVRYFALECTDVFGSEYPFDTTGFESTEALARRAMELAEEEEREAYFDPPLSLSKAQDFLETQMRCNLACRGELEPAYYWYGSDYRGSNTRYTLSYMSQMGGWAILDYALRFAPDPYSLLRLGYGSLLSSWSLLNAGRKETGYGYWFPGKEHDGAASGGYEPQPFGSTWLDQPHHGGPWYYSCEIDLGFCGYLRGAATILARDPLFGTVCYGGTLSRGEGISVLPQDGVNRRFHYVGPEGRLHLLLASGRLTEVLCDPERKELACTVDLRSLKGESAGLSVEAAGLSGWSLSCGGQSALEERGKAELRLPCGEAHSVVLRFPVV